MVQIREATEADYAEIGRIFHQAVRITAKAYYTEQQVCAWSPEELPGEHWRRRTEELRVLVAAVDGHVAGFIGFSRLGYLDLLFVGPGFLRRGVATALLQQAEAELRELGVGHAWTQASLAAQRFFSINRYQVTREQTVVCNGVELTNSRMEKSLNG